LWRKVRRTKYSFQQEKIMDNKKLWLEVCVTAPHAVKPITGKQYKGNSPKPYWIIERATEVFGPCGIGWGLEVLDERFERFGEVESLHIARVQVWYMLDGKKGVIEQMGQTRASYMAGSGKFIVDEDAPKKSVTDGMVKCLSMIGFAGDIFSGQWDDSKYVEWAAEETARRENPPAPVINADQVIELKDLIKETKTDEKGLFAWVSQNSNSNVTKVEEIPNMAYVHVKKILEKKKVAA
jgi:hypothetical protein